MTEPGQLVQAGHLGGYMAGGDPGTFYPDLWAWLVDVLGVRSVLDVGCGEGHSTRWFADRLGPANVLGVDGVRQDDPLISIHDFTWGPWRPLRAGGFDLCWTCEFVEHVAEAYVPNFLDAFRAARTVAMTHALPDQPGYHHVNCRPADYWIGAMAAAGFALEEALTSRGREVVPEGSYFYRSGLIFSKRAGR